MTLVARAHARQAAAGRRARSAPRQRACSHRAPQAEIYQINYMDPFRPQPPTCGVAQPIVGRDLGLHPRERGLLRRSWARRRRASSTSRRPGRALADAAPSASGWRARSCRSSTARSRGPPNRASTTTTCSTRSTSSTGTRSAPADPYVHGFTFGDDMLGMLGNESFHPNAVRPRRALSARRTRKWGPTLGNPPNDPSPAPKRVSVPQRRGDRARWRASEVEGPVAGKPVLLAVRHRRRARCRTARRTPTCA